MVNNLDDELKKVDSEKKEKIEKQKIEKKRKLIL